MLGLPAGCNSPDRSPSWNELRTQTSDDASSSSFLQRVSGDSSSSNTSLSSVEDTAQYSEQLAAEVGFYENFTRRRLGVLLEEDATEENTTPQNEKPLVTSRADNHVVEPVLNDDHVGRKANGSAEVTEEEQVTNPEKEEESTMPALDLLTPSASELNRAEMEFSWELYLEEMNAYPVPPEAFPHVKDSLENGLRPGEFLEYQYQPPDEKKKEAKRLFWYIEIIHASSPDIFVRFMGLENEAQEAFWLDLRVATVFPFGHCTNNKKEYQHRPPKIVCKYRAYLGDLDQRIKKGLVSPTAAELAARGLSKKDRFEVNQWLEVIDEEKPKTVWPAMVEKNTGGRLMLRYKDGEEKDVLWIFCTDYRLQPIAWGENVAEYYYIPPSSLQLPETAIAECKAFVKSIQKEKNRLIPAHVFPPLDHPPRTFEKGNHVEFLHPRKRHQICPAVITDVSPHDKTITVEILDFHPDSKKVTKVCHSQSLDILPINWCKKNGVRLQKPPSWVDKTPEKEMKDKGVGFTWQKFVDEKAHRTLATQKSFAHLSNLPNPGFARGMRLEVSNPERPNELCTATVVKVLSPLLWVHINSYGQSTASTRNISVTHYVTFSSTEMFPVGFCGSNDYPLQLPRLITQGRRMASLRSRSFSQSSAPFTLSPSKSPKAGTLDKPKVQETVTVYINPRCNCGPLMSMKKVINLPKYIGPGPVQLVLQSLIASLITCGTRPAKLQQLIAATGDYPRSKNWERIKTKAKIGGRRQVGIVDVVKNASQVPDFLRNLCILYEACPNLISTTEPQAVSHEHAKKHRDCSEQCHQFVKPETKTNQVRRPKLPRSNTETSLKDKDDEKDEEKDEEAVIDKELDDDASSRAVSIDGDLAKVPSVPIVRSLSSKLKAESETVDNPRKRLRSNVEENGEKKAVGEVKEVNGKHERESPVSSEGAEEVTEPKKRKVENGGTVEEKEKGSVENDRPLDGRLVDDSDYILHFYKEADTWSMDEVYGFLKKHLPQSKAPEMMRREGIDGDVLLMMCSSDLRFMNLDPEDLLFVGNLIERIVFSAFVTKGTRFPMYANWK